jgi:hypothetical protein
VRLVRVVFDTSFWSADVRERELRRWAGLGPVGYRVRDVIVTILLMMATAGAFLLLSTLASLCPEGWDGGSRAGRPSRGQG